MLPTVNDAFTAALADKICERLTGLCFAAQEADLRLRLALEQRVTGASAISFGLDRLSTTDAAAYLGLQAETLRATAKCKALDLPTPYIYGKKMYCRSLTLGWKSSAGSRPLPMVTPPAPVKGHSEGKRGETDDTRGRCNARSRATGSRRSKGYGRECE
jgi:hypothetical protein